MEPAPHKERIAICRAVYELMGAPGSSESKVIGDVCIRIL